MHSPQRILFFAVLAASVTSVAAVTSQSLWIDEAHSALKAMAPGWQDFLHGMSVERGSDLQMPLYMLMLWVWEKIFGASEFALRAMNIPLFVAAVSIAAVQLRQPSLTRIFFVLFTCSSAFVWAYLDEARPYILQFFAATLLMVPTVNTATTRKPPSTGTLALFGFGAFLLCASSLIGVIFTAFYGAALLFTWLRIEPLKKIINRRDVQLSFVLFGAPLLILGIYYGWTLNVGAKASGVGSTTIASAGFCFYEILGFHGLGPGRLDLRKNPTTALAPFLPFLGSYAAILFLFLIGGFASPWHGHPAHDDKTPTQSMTGLSTPRRTSRMEVSLLPALMGAAIVCVLLVGIFGGFRVLGRHLMPIMPLLLLGFSILAYILWNQRTILSRLIVISMLAMMLSSALAQRIAPRHAKDDYRRAAAIANAALHNNKVVWWVADGAAAFVYQAPIGHTKSPDRAWLVQNPSWSDLCSQPTPDIIISSKPDIFDSQGTVARYIAENHFSPAQKFQAFTILKREGK